MATGSSGDVYRDPGTAEQARALSEMPLLGLLARAGSVHAANWPEAEIQNCRLLSIKTGSCPEDCSYCPQSARYATGLDTHALLPVEDIVQKAKEAKAQGASRFCMGAAWRSPPKGEVFSRVLQAVRGVKDQGLEVCATLGMVGREQAEALRDAGLDVYNHNIDTSPEHYGKVITTRKFSQRLETLAHVRAAGLQVCCGGIVGMGESREDRLDMLTILASLSPQPESVPINLLVRSPGTPLADAPDMDPLELVRTIAIARVLLPRTRIRLSAGRKELSREAQTLCFVAGANSLFSGEKLLTTPLPGEDFDMELMRDLTGSTASLHA